MASTTTGGACEALKVAAAGAGAGGACCASACCEAECALGVDGSRLMIDGAAEAVMWPD